MPFVTNTRHRFRALKRPDHTVLPDPEPFVQGCRSSRCQGAIPTLLERTVNSWIVLRPAEDGWLKERH